jgi:hypothetical protein
MPLYHHSGVSVESWIDLSNDVDIRHEADPLDNKATIFFGSHDDYVLNISRKNLEQVISVCTTAIAELNAGTPLAD